MALALLAIGQVVLVARAAVVTVNAARHAVRSAAIGHAQQQIQAAAASGGLDPSRLTVRVTRTATTVTVSLEYRQPTTVALVGRLVGDVHHREQLTMWREDQPR